jgi:hypothetical protein
MSSDDIALIVLHLEDAGDPVELDETVDPRPSIGIRRRPVRLRWCCPLDLAGEVWSNALR